MFIKEDLARYRALKKAIESGDFQIKGNAVIPAASLFAWFERLEKKIQDYIDKKEKNEKKKKSKHDPLGEKK